MPGILHQIHLVHAVNEDKKITHEKGAEPLICNSFGWCTPTTAV